MRVRRKPWTCLLILVSINLAFENISKTCIIIKWWAQTSELTDASQEFSFFFRHSYFSTDEFFFDSMHDSLVGINIGR
jgi:hypothetical protein